TQLAAEAFPASSAAPWTLFSYAAMKPARGPIFALTSGSSRWQERQTFSWAIFKETSSPFQPSGVNGWLWQDMQPGAPLACAFRALPCAEAAKFRATCWWHEPHDSTGWSVE